MKRAVSMKVPVRKAGLFALGLGTLWTRVALAEGGAGFDAGRLLAGLLDSVIYSVLGLVLLVVAYKVFGAVVPFDLNKELAEDDNPAVGVFMAGVFVALGLVIAAAISG